MRGYFGIGIYAPKYEVNIGTLWRSAYQLGATFIFTIGGRWRRQSSDTTKTHLHIPLFHYADWSQFSALRPRDCPLVGVEMGGRNLSTFAHPQRALYLLGAEDNGLPNLVQEQCQHIVSLEAVRLLSFNVAVAGSIVMYDRLEKVR